MRETRLFDVDTDELLAELMEGFTSAELLEIPGIKKILEKFFEPVISEYVIEHERDLSSWIHSQKVDQ